jgi:imidazolonepropionase-like amidohydrolase
MRVHRHGYVLPALLLFFILSWSAPADVGPTYAIRNAKIVPVTGPAIDKGTLVIRDGLIQAIGPADKVAIPEDAEVFEAEGLTAYPGLISAHTNLFLEDAGAPARSAGETVPSPAEIITGGAVQSSSPQNAELMVIKSLKPKKATLDGFLKAGFTTVLTAPNRGIFQGQSVIVNLNGEDPGRMVVKNPAALHINFTTNRGGYPSSLMGTIAYIRQSFLDADHYATVQALYAKNLKGMKRPEFDPFLEALGPYVKDRKPIVFQCNNYEEIKRALKIIDEFNLNAALTHLNEAWRDTDVLKKAGLPLFVTLDFRPPNGSKYVSQGEDLRKKAEAEIYPANAANLAKAGLKFALTTLGLNDAATAIKNIQTAIKAGLSKDEALKALTIQPALFLGLAQQLGSLEAGKIANVILTKGELFDEKTQVDKVFVDGVLWKF